MRYLIAIFILLFSVNCFATDALEWDNEFEDPTNGDFTLLNTGNCYEGSEITNTDDSEVPTDDIEGDARNTGSGEQTSIGADEYVAAGGSNAPTGTIYGPLVGPMGGPI